MPDFDCGEENERQMIKPDCYGYVKCGEELVCRGCLSSGEQGMAFGFHPEETDEETKICCGENIEACDDHSADSGLMECVVKKESGDCCWIEEKKNTGEERSLLLDEIKSGLEDIVKLQNYRSNDQEESDVIEENNVIKVL